MMPAVTHMATCERLHRVHSLQRRLLRQAACLPLLDLSRTVSKNMVLKQNKVKNQMFHQQSVGSEMHQRRQYHRVDDEEPI